MSQNVHLGAKYGHFDDAILHRLLCNAVLYPVRGNMKDRGGPFLSWKSRNDDGEEEEKATCILRGLH